ncbi:MAG TPA: hypothetical protein VIC63_08075 [Candidatus Limnocylindria bacterium]|jgi:hypothetical protein
MHPPLAYIDPGTGSLILQAILAALLAIPFVFRRTIGGFWHRLRGDAQTEDVVPSEATPPDGPNPADH